MRFSALTVLTIISFGTVVLADDSLDCFKKTGDTAIAACTRMIKSGKYHGQHLAILHALRGDASRKKGAHKLAIADYDRMLQLDPENLYGNYARGMAKLAIRDFDGALADYNRIIELGPKLDPRKPAVYVLRGIVKEKKGDLDGAISDFSRAIELDPENIAAYRNRGQARQKKGDGDGAAADFAREKRLSSAPVSP